MLFTVSKNMDHRPHSVSGSSTDHKHGHCCNRTTDLGMFLSSSTDLDIDSFRGSTDHRHLHDLNGNSDLRHQHNSKAFDLGVAPCDSEDQDIIMVSVGGSGHLYS